MADQIQLRRDTAANWTSVDPVLAQGEPGLETDTGKIKYGDGVSAWSALPYFAGDGGSAYTLPVATDAVLGGVKIGSGVSVAGDGTISVAPQPGTGTDLSYTAATRELASSTGNNATLPEVIVDGTSGLMTGTQARKLTDIAAGAQVNPTAMSQAVAETGTDTTAQSVSAAVLKAAVIKHAPEGDGTAITTGTVTPGTGNIDFRTAGGSENDALLVDAVGNLAVRPLPATAFAPFTEVRGILPQWVDADTIGWSGGVAYVNGSVVNFTAANSGNLLQTDPGLSATGVWNHYLVDAGAGVGAIEMVLQATTGPTWSDADQYWTLNGDNTRRWVGWHYVEDDGGTRKITPFLASASMGELEAEFLRSPAGDTNRLQNGIAAVSNTVEPTDVPVTNSVTATCKHVLATAKIRNDAGLSMTARLFSYDADADIAVASSRPAYQARTTAAAAGEWFFNNPVWCPVTPGNPQLFHGWGTEGGSPTGFLVDCFGARSQR